MRPIDKPYTTKQRGPNLMHHTLFEKYHCLSALRERHYSTGAIQLCDDPLSLSVLRHWIYTIKSAFQHGLTANHLHIGINFRGTAQFSVSPVLWACTKFFLRTLL